jgi:hypothetical protein
MAERWQQWMPFHIDRFRGSPDVRAMHPAAQMGYLYLLASAWQSDDCTISSDPLDLASDSCLGDDLWAQYNVRIIRKFETVENGRLRNDVLYFEWKEAKRIFESRVAAAKKTTEIRSPRKSSTVTVVNNNGHRPQTDTLTQRLADTITGTSTLTLTEEQKQIPSVVSDSTEVLRVYEAYPHKVGKGAAIKAIEKSFALLRKRNELDPEKFLLERIQGWIDKRERDRAAGNFVPEYPNPSTWFNQERYDDEDNLPKPKKEWHVLTDEEAEASWEEHFAIMGMGQPHA